MRNKPVLDQHDATTALNAAIAYAEAHTLRMSVAIVDDGGYPLSLRRMDGAGLLTADVAMRKARTAALLRGPSKLLADRVANEPALLALTDYLPMAGGIPAKVDGICAGAIGVSGGSPEQDEAVGAAGLAAIELVRG